MSAEGATPIFADLVTALSGVEPGDRGIGDECRSEANRADIGSLTAWAVVLEEDLVVQAREHDGQMPLELPCTAVPTLDLRAVSGQAERAVPGMGDQQPARQPPSPEQLSGTDQAFGHRGVSAEAGVQGEPVDCLNAEAGCGGKSARLIRFKGEQKSLPSTRGLQAALRPETSAPEDAARGLAQSMGQTQNVAADALLRERDEAAGKGPDRVHRSARRDAGPRTVITKEGVAGS